jgi:hypothetical protein
MKPIAKPFYRAALDALGHAHVHSREDGVDDPVQVVLSLDFAVEMLLKALLLNRGESIMLSGGKSIGIFEAMKKVKLPTTYLDAASIEVLHEKRNNLQHFAGYMDIATVSDLYDTAVRFAEEAITELGETLPGEFKLSPSLARIPTLGGMIPIFESEFLQRDMNARNGTVVWSQGEVGSSSLGVWAKQSEQEPTRLTPADTFEYMPKTDGTSVVAYRQSGGVVLYDLASGERKILSETGGPTDILGDYVATQGREISDGLGGGISLFNRTTGMWTDISVGGDSARLTESRIFWQELDGEKLVIKYRAIDETNDEHILIPSGSHPSPSGDLVAWADWVADSEIHVTSITGEEVFSGEKGIFPSLCGTTIAYLQPSDDTHILVVQDIYDTDAKVVLPWVGFPIGSGPVVTEDGVYFESSTGRERHAIWQFNVS